MKRFRRHGQESQRDRLKQELFQFNKVSEPGNVTRQEAKLASWNTFPDLFLCLKFGIYYVI